MNKKNEIIFVMRTYTSGGNHNQSIFQILGMDLTSHEALGRRDSVVDNGTGVCKGNSITATESLLFKATPSENAVLTPSLHDTYHAYFLKKHNISGEEPHKLIVGGTEVKEGDYPYLARIQIGTEEGYYFCSVTLIRQNWILSAAHCFNFQSYQCYSCSRCTEYLKIFFAA